MHTIMPGTRCTVAACNNSFAKTKKAGMPIMYHQFPKAENIRNIWIQRCRRAGEWNPNSCHVCSIHFTDDDYKEDIHSFGRKRLKSTAVPSMFLTEISPEGFTSTQQRKRKKLSLDDEISNNCIYFKVEHVRSESETDNLQVYKIIKTENSPEKSIEQEVESENEDAKIVSCTDYTTEEKQNNENFPELQYVTVTDKSIQVNDDFFLNNYKSLIDKNKFLELELHKWKNKCKILMNQVTSLRSKVDNNR